MTIPGAALPPVGRIPVSFPCIAIRTRRLEVPDIQRQMRKASTGLDVVHVQYRSLLRASPADYTPVTVLQEGPVAKFLPCPRLQELPASGMREMAGIGAPEAPALDEVEHLCTHNA